MIVKNKAAHTPDSVTPPTPSTFEFGNGLNFYTPYSQDHNGAFQRVEIPNQIDYSS